MLLAQARLDDFADRARRYAECRNLPSVEGTSRLSPHLHFGEISPATVWHAVADAGGSVDVFLGELGWRDYAQNVIVQYPEYASRNAREAYDALPWRVDAGDLAAWQQGRTGYPIVDAGMRELWHTGWMHNRVRMIAASFLVKHLLIDWREGDARTPAPEGKDAFDVYFQGAVQGTVVWDLQGTHNRMNALAAISAARHVGVPPAQAIEPSMSSW